MRILFWVAFVTAAYPQGISQWHRASKKECAAEIKQEYRAMAKIGFIGDPPITLGSLMGTTSADGRSFLVGMEPCGYTDGKHFRGLYLIAWDGKKYEITEAQYYALWVPSTQEVGVMECSVEEEKKLFKNLQENR